MGKTMKGLCLTALLSFGASAQASVILMEDFDDGSSSFTGAGGIVSAGGFDGTGNVSGNIYRNTTSSMSDISLSGLAGAGSLTISFDLLAIDSWDGNTRTGGNAPQDFFNVTLSSGTAFSETIDVFLESDGSISTSADASLVSSGSNLGFSGYVDSVYSISFDVSGPFSDPSTLSFFASGGGWQGGTDESWGIDNLKVTAETVNEVPEPSSLWLLGAGLLGLAGRRASL